LVSETSEADEVRQGDTAGSFPWKKTAVLLAVGLVALGAFAALTRDHGRQATSGRLRSKLQLQGDYGFDDLEGDYDDGGNEWGQNDLQGDDDDDDDPEEGGHESYKSEVWDQIEGALAVEDAERKEAEQQGLLTNLMEKFPDAKLVIDKFTKNNDWERMKEGVEYLHLRQKVKAAQDAGEYIPEELLEQLDDMEEKYNLHDIRGFAEREWDKLNLPSVGELHQVEKGGSAGMGRCASDAVKVKDKFTEHAWEQVEAAAEIEEVQQKLTDPSLGDETRQALEDALSELKESFPRAMDVKEKFAGEESAWTETKAGVKESQLMELIKIGGSSDMSTQLHAAQDAFKKDYDLRTIMEHTSAKWVELGLPDPTELHISVKKRACETFVALAGAAFDDVEQLFAKSASGFFEKAHATVMKAASAIGSIAADTASKHLGNIADTASKHLGKMSSLFR